MLINDLKNDEELINFISENCCENEICVDIDHSVAKNDYLVIKIDDFYQVTVPSPNTPKSPDCLIVQICEEGHFHIYVAELKNVKSEGASDLNRKSIREKFETCLHDFMSDRFRRHFYNNDIELKLKLLLVAGKVTPEYTKNFTLDFLLGIRWIKFANKYYGIEGIDPNPTIKSC